MTPLAAVLTILELLTCLNRHVGRMVLWDTLLAFFPDICLFGITCLPNSYGRCVYSLADVGSDTTDADGGMYMCRPNTFCLTIDDFPGDSPSNCNALLDVLKAKDCKATFFVTAGYITDAAQDVKDGIVEVVKRAVREGHQLANHCCEDRSYFTCSAADFKRDLCQAQSVIDDLILQVTQESNAAAPAPPSPLPQPPPTSHPQPPPPQASLSPPSSPSPPSFFSKLFRPPLGLISSTMSRALKEDGYEIILGTTFTNDPFIGGNLPPASTPTPQAGPSISYHIKRNVQAVTSSSEKGGVILIMHTPNANNRTNTIFVVDGILSILNGRGFKGCTIEEALQEKV